MCKIYDNLLPNRLVKRIENTLSSSKFYWFALDNLSLGTQDQKSNFIYNDGYEYIESAGFTKPFYKDDLWYDPYDMYMASRMILDYFCQETGIKLNRLLRIKANLLLESPNHQHDEMSIHSPHLDNYNDHHVLVYYVNDSDGDTILFNEKWTPENDGKDIHLTTKARVQPKQGRILHFDGKHYHTSQNPINHKTRMIININFV
jgi:hypothetical protein